VLLIDGLAYGAFPEALIRDLLAEPGREIVALVHHPVGFETGLGEVRAEELIATERAALALARHVVVTSRATKRTLERDFDVPVKKITVAEPGTDPALRASGTGMPMQILTVGAVSTRKAYDILVRALAPLADHDWRLIIAGATDRDPAAVEVLEGQIAASGLGDRIRLAGKVVPATLERFYDSTDLFVMPSLYEGYGMVLAEAMARGLPIVCTTGGAAADTVPDAAALKVAPGDPQALGDAIRRALDDRKLRSRLADAAWDAGRTLPTWNETARRIAATVLGMKI
ncbi:MAG: glycosyltransferase family 4 protein, partial [Hyphomicrobium sp.]